MINVRRMTLQDVDQVAAIERATFATPWSRASFESEMTTNMVARYLVAEQDNVILGFGGMHIILDEGHITNIAVRAQDRGRGIGKLLLQSMMQYASNLGAAYLTLEVRQSNAAAIALYTSHGFIAVNRRKDYYENGEDALLMVSQHMPAAQEDFMEAETIIEEDQ
ncbi:MAG: ribosomal protein S18-alanine N-acetyltransferase [Christensenellales bacterium]|jgi:ribosomal-protein-alanine N-acetyltransferase